MRDLITHLFGILGLRSGPQDLPPGQLPMVTAIACYVIVTSISLNTTGEAENPAAVVMLAVAVPLVLVAIVLNLRGLAARWGQTVTALFGTSTILSAAALVLTMFSGDPAEPAVPAALASLLLFIWSFAVDAHIWRHALQVSFVAGLAVAVVLFAATLFVITALAGPL